jgi:NifU-like protein involved in Fe-S cluster formation
VGCAGAVRRRDDDGRFARFSVRLIDGVIADVAFEATTCVTLVAYCELAAQRVTGQTLRAAAGAVQVQALQAGLPLVPAGQRERARLAAQALMATVVESARRQPE